MKTPITKEQLTADEQLIYAYAERLKAAAIVYLDVSAKNVPFYDKAMARRPFDMLLHPSDLIKLISTFEKKEVELRERRKAAMDAEPVAISDDMAYAFHHALTDSSLGTDEVEEIKVGLRAAFANVAAPPAAPVVAEDICDSVPNAELDPVYQCEFCHHDENGDLQWHWEDVNEAFYEQYDEERRGKRRILYHAGV